MYLQDLIFELQKFWADRGCVIEQPVDVEVGAVPGSFGHLISSLSMKPRDSATTLVPLAS